MIWLITSDDEFERIINVNPRGIWNCMKTELRQMTSIVERQGVWCVFSHRALI